MRIRTNHDHAWRADLYDQAAKAFDESTRTGGIDAACEFSTQMLKNLECAAEHPDMTEELAKTLSTNNVKMKHYTVSELEIDS